MGDVAPGLWVFAYGSLMWRPDFPFAEAHPARLDGFHRRFCIISRHYRGTDERPGLVLGLDRGGSCHGRVFRVGEADADAVLHYLRRREQISGVYREAHVNVRVMSGSHDRIAALAFLAERAHPSYVRGLTLRQQANILVSAAGTTGSNLEYLVSTLHELRSFGIREPELERLLVTLGPVRARAKASAARTTVNRRDMKDWPRKPVLRLADVKRFTFRARL
ncbi:MAG: gamma-glutamylcyclotransferase [Hyphomicrobiaceae bacterium]|nr:gamma-glutamylcyclotransferase [Hyphomicrobiaceae bacterium]